MSTQIKPTLTEEQKNAIAAELQAESLGKWGDPWAGRKVFLKKGAISKYSGL